MRILLKATSMLAGAACLAFAAPAAMAQTGHNDVEVYEINGGDYAGKTDRRADGRENPEDQVGAGHEHSSIVQLASGEILIFSIASKEGIPGDIEGDGIYEFDGINPLPGEPYAVPDTQQLLCTSIVIDPLLGPQLNAQHYITNTDGNRDRNGMHPETSLHNGGLQAQVTYNYAPNADVNDNGKTCNANHACAWSRIIGSGCVALSDPGPGGRGDLIQAHNDDNCSERAGGGAVTYDACMNAAGQTCASGSAGCVCTTKDVEFHGCNGNGSDDAWASENKTVCDPSDPDGDGYFCNTSYEWEVSILEDEERSRGDCFVHSASTPGAEYVMCYQTAGNTQPPNKGVAVQLVYAGEGEFAVNGNGEQGRLMYSKGSYPNGMYVMESVRDADGRRIYRTEIRCSQQGGDELFCRYQDGYGRGGNKRKGEYAMSMTNVKVGMNSIDVQSLPQQMSPSIDVTHGHMISTMWGTTGAEELKHFYVAGVHIGSSTGAAQGVLYSWDAEGRTVTEEGQYSLRAAIDSAWISNIYGNNPNTQGRNFLTATQATNPGYGVIDGYMSDVKSFVAIPGNTRTLRDEPEPGMDYRINEDKLGLDLILVPAVIDAPAAEEGGDIVGDGSDSNGDGTGGDDTGNGGSATRSEPSGCAAGGLSSGSSALFALGFALFFVIRRRRR